MQEVNKCLIKKHQPLRKMMSNDYSIAEDSFKFSKGLHKSLPSQNSILARRQMQNGFSLKPINTKLNKKKSSCISLNELLGEMKARMSNCESETSSSHCHSDVEYIFVNPANTSPRPKRKKEIRIDSCLNSLGIFQINMNVALNEYHF